MAAPDDDFEFLLAAVRRLLGEIRDEIAPHAETQERGALLAEHVLLTLDAITARVDEEQARYPNRIRPESKAAGSRDLRFYAQLVWATHDALLWLRPAGEVLDLGALYFADEAALALLDRGIEVVPVEASDYMYWTSSWPFKKLFEKYLQKKMPEGDRPIVLAFPAHERRTMLLHALFVHELGHASVDHHRLVDQVLNPLKRSPPYAEALATSVKAASGIPAARVEAEAENRAEDWLEELLCDALAFTYLGPTYLFAFAEMGLSVSWAEPSEDHPSTTLRTKLLVDLAEAQGWSGYLEARLPRIWDWLKFAAEAQPAAMDIFSAFAEEVCRQAWRSVVDAPKGVLGDQQFLRDAWVKEEEHFSDLLTNDVLPVERLDGNPASHAEIMLASWLQAIDKHKTTPAAISASVREDQYHRFVAKALEMSTLMRIWEDLEDAPAQA